MWRQQDKEARLEMSTCKIRDPMNIPPEMYKSMIIR